MMKNNLKISTDGVLTIKLFESLKLSAYQDKAGVWTIGYGSTYYENGNRVKKGDRLADAAAAGAVFAYTLITYQDAVNQLVQVQLSQSQFDALVSFAYNVGTNGFAGSTLLRYLNKGLVAQAADEFLKWDKVTDPDTHVKVVDENLLLRRKRERLTFLKGVISTTVTDPRSTAALNTLHPAVRLDAFAAWAEAQALMPANVQIIVIEGLRSFQRSNALFAQGRTTPGEIVTDAPAGQSYHNYGLAFDFAMVTNGKDDTVVGPQWMKVVAVMKKHGWIWGGDFSKKIYDAPHFQKTLGHRWPELLQLHNAGTFISGTTYVKI